MPFNVWCCINVENLGSQDAEEEINFQSFLQDKMLLSDLLSVIVHRYRREIRDDL